MNPKLYWIDGPWQGKLAISARPRGGDWLEDDISGWRRAGVDVVVSLLTTQENADLQLGEESSLSQPRGLRFLSFPVEDRGVPVSQQGALAAVAKVNEMLQQGKNVAVHCRQGIGRSGMFVTASLVLCGWAVNDAMNLVSQARGLTVPETPEQREWIREISKKISLPIQSTRASVK
jgi:protein-tyrosine phosphatase